MKFCSVCLVLSCFVRLCEVLLDFLGRSSCVFLSGASLLETDSDRLAEGRISRGPFLTTFPKPSFLFPDVAFVSHSVSDCTDKTHMGTTFDKAATRQRTMKVMCFRVMS